MKKILMVIAIFVTVTNCSSMQTNVKNKGDVKLSKYGSYTIQVRTPSPNLSSLVYEFAVQEFSKSLDIAEKEKGNGTIEIIFSSQGESAFMGSSTTTANAQGYGSGWYTGNTYYNTAHVQGQATTVSSGETFTWQNSTLFVVVRDSKGHRLYSADYKYKGGWEFSGWVVNTPEEAARLCIERVHKQMGKDAVLSV
jgi:hypothetical protein